MTTPASTPKSPAAQASLSWKMKKAGNLVEVVYRIENRSGQRIYVCDKLLSTQNGSTWSAFEGASLQNVPGRPDTAQIVVGTPPTDADTMAISPVTFRPLEPGQSLEATRKLPLPLASYNVMGGTEPLGKKVKQALLIVQSFIGEPPSWSELSAEDGSKIRIPQGFTPRDLQADPLPLP